MKSIFCGNGSLLIQCAEAFQQAGGQLLGVITADAQIAAWAAAQNIPHLGTPEAPDLDDISFDWLFSVANLTVLPAALIERASRGAINFHDGPLPERAGLNVPVWAILEGAQTHAITWHEMLAAVDAGAALKVRNFDIRETDTAFSLNASCYEAGLDSFRELLADLQAGRQVRQPLTGARGWYGRAKRPEALATLNFNHRMADLDRLMRALDFGGYANPLAVPKLWTGQALLAVTRLEMVPEAQGPAGQVLAVDGTGILVAVKDGAVRLSGLMDMAGRVVDVAAAGLMRGQNLPETTAIDVSAVGKAEPGWEQALLNAAPAWPPYPVDHGAGQGAQSAPFNTGAAGQDTVLAAYLAWVCGLTGQGHATIALKSAEPAAPYLSPLRPISLGVDAKASPRSLTTAVAETRAAALASTAMAADLGLRIAHPETRDRAMRALSVVYAGDDSDDAQALGGADLAIATGPTRLIALAGVFTPATLQAMAAAFETYLAAFAATPDAALADLPLGAGAALHGPNLPIPATRIHDAIAAMAAKTPDAPALEAGAVRLSYAALNTRAEGLAGALVARGAGPGKVVGLCLERSADLIIAMLAILKTGAAYLPLDPAYPVDRLAYMTEDAGAPLIVASRKAATDLSLEPGKVVFPDATGPLPANLTGSPDDLAYLIYTSGSTGKPKGVMIPHRAVSNFFAGMDAAIPLAPGARLLAVTSVSFDISVLEILWVLARGATLVLQTDGSLLGTMPDFSLFYFASEAAGTGHHAYRLLLEGARFADTNGFAAIWTPERHFHAFGGLYPNPAISSAALAGITKNVKLRAGSSVAPLHHPVQVAEDWALVDNLSNGRAGMAIASGWQPNDFVLRPEAFAKRKDIMLEAVDTMRRLWAGEALPFPGHDGKPVMVEIHPKPMQKPIPLWLTAAGNPETFAAAARLGCGVLTHLLGQTFEEVETKIAAYRAAWRAAGHAGQGHVVLMLHTFVGQDEEQVRNVARGPMKGYLKSAVDLVRRAAWTFPTIVNRADSAGVSPQEMFEKEALSPEDLDQLLDHAFERYYQTSGLFGTPESAKDIVRRVTEIGVDEVACLIDFGIDTDLVLENLPNIKTLMNNLQAEGGVARKVSVADDVIDRAITHLQCTPSMATFLTGPGAAALAQLDCLMVGGEAFPPDLAADIRAGLKGRLLNMYGPTETTIWSSVAALDAVGGKIPLGAPIANTVLSVRSPDGRALPDLVEGELWIGGAGVADGYWQRADLTAERFVMADGIRFYRTGDLVRAQPDGTLEFLGRIDNQVKIRGHRIELGEIEAALRAQPSIRDGLVHPVLFGPGDVRLIGYVTGKGADPVALRAKLAETLPEIMLPAQIVVLDRMPLTPNGKIDRKALPKPMAEAAADVVAAADDTEATIAGIWAAALGVKAVSTTANFFDLGGHSLLVVQVQRQMRDALARDIAITDIFRFPTVRALAAHLGDAGIADRPDAAARGVARAAARLARMGRR
jgi:natural product biosynthesis luciferase-like monooxygenase protein